MTYSATIPSENHAAFATEDPVEEAQGLSFGKPKLFLSDKQQEEANKKADNFYRIIQRIMIELAEAESRERKEWCIRIQKQKQNLREEMENKEQREMNIDSIEKTKRPFRCKTMGYYFPDTISVPTPMSVIFLT